jgi:phosphoglycolate phosphatase-like HAD superfamily hydrolase
MNVKMICFDMDGTIANLYGVSGWLEKLRAFDPTPYAEAEPLWDMEELNEVLNALRISGIEIRIITWLSMETTVEYSQAVREAKREWLDNLDFPYDNFHGVAYGATKADSVRKYLAEDETAILIDDNDKVRRGWHLGDTINPTEENIIEILKGLLNQ